MTDEEFWGRPLEGGPVKAMLAKKRLKITAHEDTDQRQYDGPVHVLRLGDRVRFNGEDGTVYRITRAVGWNPPTTEAAKPEE